MNRYPLAPLMLLSCGLPICHCLRGNNQQLLDHLVWSDFRDWTKKGRPNARNSYYVEFRDDRAMQPYLNILISQGSNLTVVSRLALGEWIVEREKKNVFTKCKETKKTNKQHIYPRLHLNRRCHYKDKDDLIPQLTIDTHPTT